MSYNAVTFSVASGVAELALNSPESYNAVNGEMMEEMMDAVARCYHDDEVRALVLTGTGPAFCAGGNVKAMSKELDGDTSVFFRKLVLALNGFISSLQRLPKPVVGAVNGIAVGAGVSLAMACDIVLASEKARFIASYTGIGLCGDGGFTYWLPRLVGTRRAMELVLTNREIDARIALELGIINRVVRDDELMNEARALANTLAQGPTVAFGKAKVLMTLSGQESLETQMELERQAISDLSITEDFREGVKAFVEKRAPSFKGR